MNGLEGAEPRQAYPLMKTKNEQVNTSRMITGFAAPWLSGVLVDRFGNFHLITLLLSCTVRKDLK